MFKHAVLLLASSAALAPLSARAVWQCSAACEFHSPHIYSAWPGLVEVVDVQLHEGARTYTKLAKYRDGLGVTTGADADEAFSQLVVRCLDTAAAQSDSLFLDTPYSPQVIDLKTFAPVEAKEACSQR